MDFLTLLKEHEYKLLAIKKRFYYLKKIEDELLKTTRGKIYSFRGDTVHDLLRDSYHMLVIDLASISKSMISKGGFFNKLRNYLNEFRRPTLPRVVAAMVDQPLANDEYLQSEIFQANLQTYIDLFPNATHKVSVADIEGLKTKYISILVDVMHDRDENRAHRFEKKAAEIEKVPFLNLIDLEQRILEIEKLLNGLRGLYTLSSYSFSDVNHSNSERMAQSVVDSILIGDRDLVERVFGIADDLYNGHFGNYTYTYREVYYNKLHSYHDKKTNEIRMQFNGKISNEELESKLSQITFNSKIYLEGQDSIQKINGFWRFNLLKRMITIMVHMPSKQVK